MEPSAAVKTHPLGIEDGSDPAGSADSPLDNGHHRSKPSDLPVKAAGWQHRLQMLADKFVRCRAASASMG